MIRPKHTPVRGPAAAALGALIAVLLVAPAALSQGRAPAAVWTPALEAEAARLEAALARSAPPADGALHVRLAFGAAADLDLYVTDPLAETVYFANERAAGGGRLVQDARCDSPAPRIEEARFVPARAGTYRVGVDYMVYRAQCGEQPAVMAYVLAIDGPGGHRVERGLARRGIFAPRVLEIAVPR